MQIQEFDSFSNISSTVKFLKTKVQRVQMFQNEVLTPDQV